MGVSKSPKKINPLSWDSLLAPLSTEEFFQNYWEKKPLYLPRPEAGGYLDLVSSRDLDFLLSSLINPTELMVRLVNNRVELKIQPYTDWNSHRSTYRLNLGKLAEGFRRGNTIVLLDLHVRFAPVQKMLSILEERLGHLMKANLYLTPASAQGFPAHYDPHDVFILQLEGEKLWKVYDSCVPFPVNKEDYPFLNSSTKPLYEVWLKPGDFLYIPRGYVHEAMTAKEYSMHLTVRAPVFTWYHIMGGMMRIAPFFRQALPVGLISGASQEGLSEESYAEFVRLLSDRTLLSEALEDVKASFQEQRLFTELGPFAALSLAKDIDQNTIFQRNPKVPCKIFEDGQRVGLKIANAGALSLPLEIKATLETILKTPQFSIQDLPQDFSEESKLKLLSTLVRYGVVISR